MIYKLLKKPFFGTFMVKWRNPLTAEEKKEWQQISIKSKSGGIIKGLFAVSKTKKSKATIVLGHPMGKEAKGYFLKRNYTNLLRENGFNTIVFDINGFGESTHGNFSYFEDITAIGIKAKELTPNIPIGYHGISLGAMFSTISFTDQAHQYDFAIIVPDRERNRSEGKPGLKQNISLFEENSSLFDENNEIFWSNPAFPQ